ncbi:MAG: hypothetical protein ACM3PP_02375 [Candidatus Saccharibacteria bacterium]
MVKVKRRQFATDLAAVLSVVLIVTGIFLSIFSGAPPVQGLESDVTGSEPQQTIEQSIYDSAYQVEQTIPAETYGMVSAEGGDGTSTTETVNDSAYQPSESEFSDMLAEVPKSSIAIATNPLAVSKSAQGFREVSCNWTINKAADTQSVVIKPGESALIKYGISAVREPERERAGVRGVISIPGAAQVASTDYWVVDQVFISTPTLSDQAWAWVPIPGAMAIFPGVAPQIPYEIEINPQLFIQQLQKLINDYLGMSFEFDPNTTTPIIQVLNYLKQSLNIDLVYQNRVAVIRKSDLSICAYSQQPFAIPIDTAAAGSGAAVLTDNMMCPPGFSIQGRTSITKILTDSDVIGYAVYVTNVNASGGPFWLVNQAVLQPEGQAARLASARVALCTTEMSAKPGLSIIKMGDHLVAKSPSIIKYGYKITNTGSVPFAKVIVTDDKCPLIQPHVFLNLDVGQSVYASAVYPVTPFTPPGDLTNVATAAGIILPDLSPDTKGLAVSELAPVIAQASWTVKILPLTGQEQPGLMLDVAADKAVARPGDTVTYYYKVKNVGDFDLHGLILTDNKFGVIDLPVTDLNIGQEFVVAKSHVVTAADGTGTLVNIGAIRGQYLIVKEITAVDDAFVVISNDSGGGSGGGGGGSSGGGGSGGGGDGPSADYSQGGSSGQSSAQSLSVPSEGLVGGPVTVVTPNEQLTVPQDPKVSAPRMASKALAHNGELPFTGGKPLAFEMLGLAMLILSLSFREPKEKAN